MKFQWFSNTPRNPQNGAWRPPKTSKMRSQEVPEIIKIMKKPEKWNLMKTIIFTMFLRGWDIRNHRFFQSTIIENRACNPSMLFDALNHINYGKVTPKWPQQVSQKSSKIDENRCWDIQGPSWVHPCTQRSPEWCQSGASRPQNASKMVSKNDKINKFECRSIWNQFSIFWSVDATLLQNIWILGIM